MNRDAVATEDVQREPDGIPHAVIGLTVLFCVIFAVVAVAMFFSDSLTGRVGGIMLAVIAMPVLVFVLQRKATRDRDHDHPSR